MSVLLLTETLQACESLLQEQKRLTQLTDTIKEKLAFYNDIEKISRQFSGSSVPVTDASFRATLKRLDECIAFVQAHVCVPQSLLQQPF